MCVSIMRIMKTVPSGWDFLDPGQPCYKPQLQRRTKTEINKTIGRFVRIYASLKRTVITDCLSLKLGYFFLCRGRLLADKLPDMEQELQKRLRSKSNIKKYKYFTNHEP